MSNSLYYTEMQRLEMDAKPKKGRREQYHQGQYQKVDSNEFLRKGHSDSEDLDPDMPNTYVNDSGDPNQIGRSEEEEIENNSDIDLNQTHIASDDLNSLSDELNESLDKSIRITGTPEDNQS